MNMQPSLGGAKAPGAAESVTMSNDVAAESFASVVVDNVTIIQPMRRAVSTSKEKTWTS